MSEYAVADRALFDASLQALDQPGAHGDILAFFLAFKFHQLELPVVGDRTRGATSGGLEDMLDRFYRKPNAAPDRYAPVCMVFNNRFKPPNSHQNNNWRDFFRYANGIGCMANEDEMDTDFVFEERSQCRHLIALANGKPACRLHPLQTKYIRGLQKPKLLYWNQSGHTYKLVDLDRVGVLEVIRPITSLVPLESLIIALYHDAPWTDRESVSLEQFVSDFNFEDTATVEYLFAMPSVDPAMQAKVQARTVEMTRDLRKQFSMTDTHAKYLTVAERRVRDVAFREAVMRAYDRTCAICGLRVRSGKDNWEAHAAHIYPHRLGGSDDVRNGLALCRSHHWAFDEHICMIDEDYNIVWGRRAHPEWRIHKRLLLPDEPEEYPDQDQSLAWHRSRFTG